MFAMRNVLFTLMFLVFLLPMSLSAAVLDGLYQVELAQEEDQSRDEVLQQAAQVMLARLAGKDVNLRSGPLAEALKDPRSLMRRIGSAGEGRVEVEFEPSLLRALLADAGLPMLGRNRPGVLLWAVESRTLGDELLGQDSVWAQRLKAAAQHRAVALAFPLGDLQDRSLISEQSIRQANQAELLEASERYAAEGTLALAIGEQGDNTRLDWSFWLNERSHSGRITEADPEQAADTLMVALANAVFEQYAVPAVSSEQLSRWHLVVREVDSLDDYASLQRLLEQLGSQSAPQLLAVEADRVTLTFEFPGSEAQLERLLSLDRRLQRVAAPAPKPRPEPVAVVDEADTEQPDGLSIPLEVDASDSPDADDVPDQPQQTDSEAADADQQTLYYRWR